MAKRLLPFFCLFVACSPPISSENQCVTDPDCGVDLVCVDGTCVQQPSGTCRSDETRPCGPEARGICKRGVHRCIEGVFEAQCFGAVNAATETCNGLDDDCDGVVDDGVITTWTVDLDGDGFGSSAPGATTQVACQRPAGFVDNASDCDDANVNRKPTASEVCDALDVDENCDGTANEGCQCENIGMTQACCSGRGTQTCTAQGGGAVLSMCSAQASTELCNAIDDDCDGQTDETFSPIAPDGGVFALDAGTLFPDGGCAVGVGACARTAAASCVQGALRCQAVAGAPGAEICNTLDDDCDGETDEATPGLCPASGQTCSAGACACPGGQTVCGASCETLGGSCSNGVGACARTGAVACVSGGVACDAVPGTPVTEICDGVDNDCDGQTDEGLKIQCLPDADNDRYPASSMTQQLCRDPSRAAFGECPPGFVAPTAALSTTPDCNDGSASVYRLELVRADTDGDGYCSGATMSQCMGAAPASGWKLAGGCQATDDCATTDAAKYRLLSVMADSDGDGFCAGSTIQQCTGVNPQPGFRTVATCAAIDGPPAIDCNDAAANEYQLLTVRADADNDAWCSGNSVSQCTGISPKPGTRLPTQCAGTDCHDFNPNATSFCQTSVSSQGRIKSCGFGIPATQGLTFDWQCPAGFNGTSSVLVKVSSTPRVSDPAQIFPAVSGNSATTSVSFTCQAAAVGEDTWRLDVTCNAQ